MTINSQEEPSKSIPIPKFIVKKKLAAMLDEQTLEEVKKENQFLAEKLKPRPKVVSIVYSLA